MTPSRSVHLRGHQILSRTIIGRDGRFACRILLFDPHQARHPLRSFTGLGEGSDDAERVALERAMAHLDAPIGFQPMTGAEPNTIVVAGRIVDVFCDLSVDGRFQAFPFLRNRDGTRSLMMQFHLAESIVGDTPMASLSRCVQRLRSHFAPQQVATA